jgi:hypothetical protein
MRAKIVSCDDDVRAFYHYKKSEPPKPSDYPCAMIEEDCDGGIGGQYYSYRFHYVPRVLSSVDSHLYLKGFVDGIEYC